MIDQKLPLVHSEGDLKVIKSHDVQKVAKTEKKGCGGLAEFHDSLNSLLNCHSYILSYASINELYFRCDQQCSKSG